MNSIKGSLILKAVSTEADEAQLITFLAKRAKNILPEDIPNLIRNAPVVLSRNVPQHIGMAVAGQLQQLGAEAAFIPHQEAPPPAATSPLEETGPPAQEGIETPVGQPHNSRVLEQHPCMQFKPSPASRKLLRTCKEVALILLVMASAWALNYSLASQYLLLSLHTMPTILAGYFFGRKQAVLTAMASILLAGTASTLLSERFEPLNLAGPGGSLWYHIGSWSLLLMIIAWALGSLHDSEKSVLQEMRKTYHGLLLILKQCITQDDKENSHRFRVAVYAAKIASYMNLDKDHIEDIRAAALLHDIGKQRVSRLILHKAARLSTNEQLSIENYLASGLDSAALLGDRLGRVLPVLVCLGHSLDRGNPQPIVQSIVPLGAKILSLADTYDLLISDNPYQKALPPQEARDDIASRSGLDFDPLVVEAFTKAFDRGEMELPGIIM